MSKEIGSDSRGLALAAARWRRCRVFFSGLLGGEDEEAAEAEIEEVEEETPREVVFYDLPEMLVNLNSAGRESSFLKIQVSLELDSAEAIPEVEAMLPRIVDNFQVYLRELRPEELSGTKGWSVSRKSF